MSDPHDEQLRRELLDVLERLGADLDSLERVDDIPRLESFVEDASHLLIARARAAGASWSAIAGRLGVSRQAAHKRFTTEKPSRTGRVIELRFERRTK